MTEKIIAALIVACSVLVGSFSSFPGIISLIGTASTNTESNTSIQSELDNHPETKAEVTTDTDKPDTQIETVDSESDTQTADLTTEKAAVDSTTNSEISKTEIPEEISPDTDVYVDDVPDNSNYSVDSKPQKQESASPETSHRTESPSSPSVDHLTARSRAVSYLNYNSSYTGYKGEWPLIALASSGALDNTSASTYLASLTSSVSEILSDPDRTPRTTLDKNKATENARVILAILSVGADPTDVGGYDLVSALADTDWVCSGTLNCPIYALIALDSCGNDYGNEKEILVDYILSRQFSDGGWALSGSKADPDVTAMAILAISRHSNRGDVTSAASRAISTLSNIQLETGEFRSWGTVNSESISQVIMALSAWNIDAAKDQRFIKNGVSALDALIGYLNDDGGFADTKAGSSRPNAGSSNNMATWQAILAITSYQRCLSGNGNIYDFG